MAIAAAVAAGCFFVIPLMPSGWKPRWAIWLLAGLLAICIALAGAAAWYWRLKKASTRDCAPQFTAREPFQWNWVLLTVFLIAVIVVFGAARELAKANPDGQWDAWSIWNLRAKFMSGPQTWRLAVSPLLEAAPGAFPAGPAVC